MYPVLFRIPLFGGIPIYGYGVLVAAGFILGTWYIQRECKRIGLDPNQALDLVFYLLIVALLGSRVLHIGINEWDRFLGNPLILFKIWEGGLVFYGGLLASTLFSFWYIRRNKLPFWKYADTFMPALALGHAVGRIGCFLAGCCHGRALLSEAWFAVTFPDNVGSFAPPHIPLYPTQLMESATEFLTFLLLFFYRKKKKFDGEIFALYLMIYSVVRTIMENYRGDLDRGFVVDAWVSTSQFISLFLFALGLFVFLRNRRKWPVGKLSVGLLVLWLAGSSLAGSGLGCAKAQFVAPSKEPKIYEKTFSQTANELYYAVRWALRAGNYPVETEQLEEGNVTTRWVPVGADSHVLPLFKRNDYGANGAYHRLEIHIVPQDDGKTQLKIGSRIQSLLLRLQSTGQQEKLILDRVSDYLRSPTAKVTNLGLEE